MQAVVLLVGQDASDVSCQQGGSLSAPVIPRSDYSRSRSRHAPRFQDPRPRVHVTASIRSAPSKQVSRWSEKKPWMPVQFRPRLLSAMGLHETRGAALATGRQGGFSSGWRGRKKREIRFSCCENLITTSFSLQGTETSAIPAMPGSRRGVPDREIPIFRLFR